MSVLYKIILLLICLKFSTYAQRFDAKFNIIANNDSVYKIGIQIKSINTFEASLGNATFRFKFNNRKLSFSSNPVEGVDYKFNFVKTNSYLYSVTKPTRNIVSVNIYYKKGKPFIISENPTEFVLIQFKKLTKSTKFKFNNFITEFYSPDSSKPWDIKINF